MSFLARLNNDRASIILETALCLPLYFVLLIFLIDMPQIMAHRQSLLGVARLDADIKARNLGDASMLEENQYIDFFWSQTSKVKNLQNINQSEQIDSDLKQLFTYTENDFANTGVLEQYPAFAALSHTRRIVAAIFNLLSFGAETHFIQRVFNTDVFYSSCPKIGIETILPAEFYAAVMNLEMKEALYVDCPARCWQPGGNSAQKVGLTLFGRIGRMINTSMGWLRFFIPIPNFNFVPES